jgi:hypothetical protein
MKIELDPTKFGTFYENLEKAVALEELIGLGWHREIKRHGHATYNNWSESYDWKIVYSSPSARIDLSVTERYIDAHFIQHLKTQKVTEPELLERFGKNELFWRVPLGYVVDIEVEGKNVEKIQEVVNKLLKT